MRKDRFTIFDDDVPTGTNTPALAVATGLQHNAALGQQNRLEFWARLDKFVIPSADTSLYIFVEHSSDAKNWLQRSSNLGDLTLLVSATVTSSVSGVFSDACRGRSGSSYATSTGPLLAYVRLRAYFTNTNFTGHLRIDASRRDD